MNEQTETIVTAAMEGGYASLYQWQVEEVRYAVRRAYIANDEGDVGGLQRALARIAEVVGEPWID